MLDGEYLNFSDRQRISQQDVKIFIDIWSWLKWDIEKHSTSREEWEDFTDKIVERFKEIPHFHLSSAWGPYCVACHCNLPGPNGEWE